ncbi:MAG: tRNA (N6-isopentenyl adenosine(37)-C2)-methylthiotransferase MiaB [Rickettsiales bacterium]|nr:tRNA (N6-isopentenyl adenosine(37)-C2)-methylthiotransferase MiaB [Rickettsiales bacterium]
MTANKELYIKTYGCQMNVYDTERMKELFIPYGYQINDKTYNQADLVILNTCHIREKAAEKIYSELGRIKKQKDLRAKEGKKMYITVAGCVAQAEGKQIIKRAPYVDFVVGPQSYHTLPALIKSKEENGQKEKVKLDFIEEEKFDKLNSNRELNNISAFLSIQEGCDKFCTYCVVPYTRGAEFSRPVSAILDEAKQLVDKGAKEIYLLGQNVNAYHGIDEKGKTSNLGKLIFALEKIDGIKRIRYTTSHPNDMHDDLYEAHAISKKLMPYLHLPIQSGSNRILEKMNRKHDSEKYLRIIEKLRIARSDIAFSSDFIVGFPGETNSDFQDTLDIIKEVKYSGCYSFKYSKRPGTPAELYDNQVSEDIKSERLKILQDLLSSQQYEFNKKFEDKQMEVLFEKKINNQIIARSEYLQPVNLPIDICNDKVVKVKIIKANPHSLNAELIND